MQEVKAKYVPVALVVLFLVIVIRNAWVGDDAYITFRTVDNFVQGYGLTWNIAERVQAYTNPLWMFLVSALYIFTGEAFFTSLVLSIALSVTTVFLFAVRGAQTTMMAVLGVLALTLSKAFVDYSTSGLENPLTHLLLLLFLLVYFKHSEGKRSLGWLALLAALCAVNRLDTVLLTMPILAYRFWIDRSWKAFGVVILGFLPLIAWEIFSVLYYGFPFPNTAYAKLNTGIPLGDLIGQGIYYLWNSLAVNPLTVIVIVIGLILPVVRHRRPETVVAIGMLLYLIYVVRIGGCFMSGRLLAAPFLMALVVLAQGMINLPKNRQLVPLAAILLLGLGSPSSPVYTTASDACGSDKCEFGRGITDERVFYFQTSSLLNIDPAKEMPAHRWAEWGRQLTKPVSGGVVIGYFGFFAPKTTYIVDKYALADPLLARLPADVSDGWRIGHFERALPAGYGKTLATGTNAIEDPNLAKYYDNLSLIVRGPIFSKERMIAIVKVNLGFYDHLLEAYRVSSAAGK